MHGGNYPQKLPAQILHNALGPGSVGVTRTLRRSLSPVNGVDMARIAFRLGLLVAALAAWATPARAQITWNVTYTDGNIVPGTPALGFADGTISGGTTIGQLRRDS